MSQAQLISPTSPTVSLINGRPATTSLEIAKFFGKRHDHVLRDIDCLLSQLPENSLQPNFGETFQEQETPFGVKQIRMFILYRDGFMLLVMGYTGKKAMQIKLAYIMAFNAMEESLDKLAAEERAKLAGNVCPPTPPPSPFERTHCTDLEMQPLERAVTAWVAARRLRRRDALRLLRQRYGLPCYRFWPRHLLQPTIDWVEAQTRASLPARQTKPVPSLPAVVSETVPADMPANFKRALADVNKWAGEWGGLVNWLHIACRPDRNCTTAIEELHAAAVTSAQTVRFALRAMHALGRERRAHCAEISAQ